MIFNKVNFFNFFPVGQGMFYCGLIDNRKYSFVYDCGTETSGVNLKTYIHFLQQWNGGNQLDFLAVSHFHKDHISGIRDLEKMIGFKKIYLPYICDEEMVREFLIGIDYFDVFNKESDNVINGENAKLIDTYTYLLNLYKRENAISAKTYQSFSVHQWEFKFFNKPISKHKEIELFVEINLLLKREGLSKISELFCFNKISDIENIYKKVFGKNSLNETSLVLLHYPVLNYSVPITLYYPNNYGKSFAHYFYPYTLLSGDITFDAITSKRIISQYPTGLSGFVQVPHHGSKYNWPSLMTYFKGLNCYVVPFGTKNQYGHPDQKLKIAIPPKDYFEVNEYSGFPYWIYN